MDHDTTSPVASDDDAVEATAEGEGFDWQSGYTATYSPEDNKLRLYAPGRLEAQTYERVREAGFRWAPQQKLFVAPAWTPAREDLLVEICGEIGDEDTGLVERAEERSERFDDYGASRTRDAERAHGAVKQITNMIPLGQPILVGHHSERRARKDAERIRQGMRRAVQMWDTAQYWKQRAAGAVRHAKYKERPDVRHRRIRTLEANQRRQQRTLDEAERRLAAWQREGLTFDEAKALANESSPSRCFPLADNPRDPPASQYEGQMSIWSALDGGVIGPEQAREICLSSYAATIEYAQRWLAHCENRLSYERAMLDEQGGIVGEQQPIAVGGRVRVRGEWLTVLRVNKSGDRITSVTTNSRYVRLKGIEEVQEYKPPSAEQEAQVRLATRVPPLANYPGEGFAHITQAQWDRIPKGYRGFELVKGTPTVAKHRVRHAHGVYVLPKGHERRDYYVHVYVTDAKRVEPPRAEPSEAKAVPTVPPPEAAAREVAATPPTAPGAQAAEFAALREQLRAGVQTVSAAQLFPTPPELAALMVETLGLARGARVLEPSAGTGRILRALAGLTVAGPAQHAWCAEVVAVEINPSLCEALRSAGLAHRVVCADFLTCMPESFTSADEAGSLGLFDGVVMNPPFARAADIAHIQHAARFLVPGGRLVALCAAGPRQTETLQPWAEASGGTWELLPEGSFVSEGTSVRAALLVFERGAS